MEEFSKTIHGLDFEFELLQEEKEYHYQIKLENHSFQMRIDDNGIWKIKNQVPIWLQELEEHLGEAIEQSNI